MAFLSTNKVEKIIKKICSNRWQVKQNSVLYNHREEVRQMSESEKEALRELLLFLADHPELVETIVMKPNKILKQGKHQKT